jgi:PhnB protein
MCASGVSVEYPSARYGIMMKTLTPYICCQDAPRAIEFYKRAFGARETEPSGKIGSAPPRSAAHRSSCISTSRTPMPSSRAVDAGAKVIRPLEDQFCGDRSGAIRDPFGHVWLVSMKKENLSAEEVQRRYARVMQQ